MPEEFFLYPLQAEIREFLWAEPFMQNFGIVTEDKQEITDQLQEAFAGILSSPNGKMGCTILIHTSLGKDMIPNIPAAYSSQCDILFLVIEQPTLNRDPVSNNNATGYSALQVAEYLIALMKQFASSLMPEVHFWEDNSPMQAPYIDKDTGLIIHSVLMHCPGGINITTPFVAAPVIAVDAATRIVTITSPMADARVYYTLDGTAPRYFGEGNPNNNGILYQGAFDGSASDQVRARAYFPDWRASTITQADTRIALRSENPEDLLSETGQSLKSE